MKSRWETGLALLLLLLSFSFEVIGGASGNSERSALQKDKISNTRSYHEEIYVVTSDSKTLTTVTDSSLVGGISLRHVSKATIVIIITAILLVALFIALIYMLVKSCRNSGEFEPLIPGPRPVKGLADGNLTDSSSSHYSTA